MPWCNRWARACTRLTSKSAKARRQDRIRLLTVVLFFEILLVASTALIAWFSLYALYRLITDES